MNSTNKETGFQGNIILRPKTVLITLLCIIAFLLLANITGLIFKFYFHHRSCYGLVPFFDLDTEDNAPSFYSSLAILFASTLLALIAAAHRKAGKRYILWAGLALIFLFLSMDEFAQIHERCEAPMKRLLVSLGLVKSPKIMFYAWVIPYLIFLLILGIAYLKFLWQLPKKTRTLFIISGIIFAAGAVGMESLSAIQDSIYGYDNAFYAFIYTCEEVLEMTGIAMFVYALLTYINENLPDFSIKIKE